MGEEREQRGTWMAVVDLRAMFGPGVAQVTGFRCVEGFPKGDELTTVHVETKHLPLLREIVKHLEGGGDE